MMLNSLFDPVIWERYGHAFLWGVGTTLLIVSVSFVIGFVLSLFVALALVSKNRFLSMIARGYIYLFRGSPMLVQLYLFYYGIGSFSDFWKSVDLWWLFGSPIMCSIAVFTLNTAAYQTEIFRGGFQSVPRAQQEACVALGLPPRVAFLQVILPQAMVLTLRPLGNEFILLIKGSAIVSLLPVFDVMGVTKLAFSRFYNFQVYLWAAVLYLIIVETVRHFVNLVEKRLTRHMPVRTLS